MTPVDPVAAFLEAADSLATMLLRKHDWHDHDGIQWLLEHGADPNRMTRWRRTAFHQAVQRDNALEIFEVLLDHGANPALIMDGKGRTPLALAVRACVDSYWMERRSPESVEALLRAGASVRGVVFPSGYAVVDELLRRYRDREPRVPA